MEKAFVPVYGNNEELVAAPSSELRASLAHLKLVWDLILIDHNCFAILCMYVLHRQETKLYHKTST